LRPINLTQGERLIVLDNNLEEILKVKLIAFIGDFPRDMVSDFLDYGDHLLEPQSFKADPSRQVSERHWSGQLQADLTDHKVL
jgi:cephalosporin hydroxylase